MKWYVLRKAGTSLLTLVIATMVVFIGVQALPGDTAQAMTAEVSDPAVLQSIRQEYGLDQPVAVQYVKWLGHAVQGDLGRSAPMALI